jgi:uncharacterized protein YqfB (UPF0267 family)
MGIYNFQPRFVPAILAGRKTHTIRAVRRHPDKPGNVLHLYTGLRHKGAKLLMRVKCVAVEPIEISEAGIRINGDGLSLHECELLAKRDGFDDGFSQMLEFWGGRLPFLGQIIHWRTPKVKR